MEHGPLFRTHNLNGATSFKRQEASGNSPVSNGTPDLLSVDGDMGQDDDV